MTNRLSISPNFLNKSIPLMLAIYMTNSNANSLMRIWGLLEDSIA